MVKYESKGAHKSCEVFASPFDLRLSDQEVKDEDVSNVYQPDLVVICDKSQLKGTGSFGVPSLLKFYRHLRRKTIGS